jgi:hypothetical protein
MNEGDGPPVVAPAAAEQKVAQAHAKRLTVGEPPIDRFSSGVDVVTSTKLDQPRLPKCTLQKGKICTLQGE